MTHGGEAGETAMAARRCARAQGLDPPPPGGHAGDTPNHTHKCGSRARRCREWGRAGQGRQAHSLDVPRPQRLPVQLRDGLARLLGARQLHIALTRGAACAAAAQGAGDQPPARKGAEGASVGSAAAGPRRWHTRTFRARARACARVRNCGEGVQAHGAPFLLLLRRRCMLECTRRPVRGGRAVESRPLGQPPAGRGYFQGGDVITTRRDTHRCRRQTLRPLGRAAPRAAPPPPVLQPSAPARGRAEREAPSRATICIYVCTGRPGGGGCGGGGLARSAGWHPRLSLLRTTHAGTNGATTARGERRWSPCCKRRAGRQGRAAPPPRRLATRAAPALPFRRQITACVALKPAKKPRTSSSPAEKGRPRSRTTADAGGPAGASGAAASAGWVAEAASSTKPVSSILLLPL